MTWTMDTVSERGDRDPLAQEVEFRDSKHPLLQVEGQAVSGEEGEYHPQVFPGLLLGLALVYTVQKKSYAPYRHKYHKGKFTSATLLHQKINFPAKKHTFEIPLTIYILGYDCEDTVKIL